MATRLKTVLQQQHLQTHTAFCREYDKIAATIDPDLVGSAPRRSQFHRWLSGDVKGLPYPHHCRILEKMLPGHTAAELFAPDGKNADVPAELRAATSSVPDHEQHATPMGTAVPQQSGRLVKSLVPPLEPGLIQRVDEFGELRALLLSTSSSVSATIGVVGPGGFGKTTLAGQLAHDSEVRCAFGDVLWIETGPGCGPARVVELISDMCVHLGECRPVFADPTQAGLHLAHVLAGRTVLLIVDNVWSANDLAPFLLGAPRCVRLVTTRNAAVCPSSSMLFRLGAMDSGQTRELLRRNLPGSAVDGLSPLATLCGGWPLLASVVSGAIGHDIRAGAGVDQAIASATEMLRLDGPGAFDVWDTDQRRAAIGHAISASLRNLDEHVTIPGTERLRDRYLDLCVFPASTAIPIPVLADWWKAAHGWSLSVTRRFCRLLADRSMISAHLADQDAIVLHDVFVTYLRHLVGEQQPDLHRSLLDAFRPSTGSWRDASAVDYLWRRLSYHLDKAGLTDELDETFSSVEFLAEKALRCGHHSLVLDHQILAQLPEAALAQQLTSASHLLQGLATFTDIAATLHIVAARAGHVIDVATADHSGFRVRTATSVQSESSGHIGAVVSVAVSGNVLVSGGEDGTVRLWDLNRKELAHKCRGHTGWVHATAVSPATTLAASAGDDTEIRLWDTASGAVIAVLNGHTQRIRSLAFTHDGTKLISGAEDHLVCVWDVKHAALLRAPTINPAPVWSIAVSPDDALIAVGGQDETVRLIDARAGTLLSEAVGHTDWVRTVAFTGARTLISGSGDRTTCTWTIDHRHQLVAGEQRRFADRVRTVSRRADRVVVGTEDAHLHVIDSGHLTADMAMPPGVDWIRSTAVTDTGDVIVACEDGAVRCWHQGHLTTIAPGTNTVWSVTHTQDGGHTVLGDSVGTLTVADESGAASTLSIGHGRVWSLDSAAHYIAAACGDGTVRLRSTADTDQSTVLVTEARRIWAVALAQSGDRLAAAGDDGRVRVWNLPTGTLVWDAVTDAGRIRSLAFNSDGSVLAAACGDGSAKLWNSDGDLLMQAQAGQGWSRTVALDPTGTRLTVGSGTGDIVLRDTATGEVVCELAGHTGRVLMLGFLDDHLISVAANGTARWWSLTGELDAEVRVDASCQAAGFDAASRRVTIATAAGVTALTVPRQSANGA
ncbi:NB-ARC domain-containing protein [Nocardia sp. NPDC002869]|uniref:WD40 domain-containing protein n=1 Tax=Nocardia sp. NPDC002869 TaxID=3161032 RepID=UPI00398D6583